MAHVITIDGSSGVGKGTLAFKLARFLGYHLLDSGAIYRALALYAKYEKVALENESALESLAHDLPLSFEQQNDHLCVFLKDENITTELRLETTGNAASKIAKYTGVRLALVDRQRAFAIAPGLVADGRDMGTCIFPEASFKFFLSASIEIRAKRRYEQLLSQGFSANIAHLIDEIKTRDDRDQNRRISPLIPAQNAIMIDTSAFNADAIFDQVCAYLHNKLP